MTGETHAQRSLEGYSPWGHKSVGHDLVTKKNRNQKEIKYAMEDSDLTPKSNGELMFTLDDEEKGNRALSPERQENITTSSIQTKNISPEEQNH